MATCSLSSTVPTIPPHRQAMLSGSNYSYTFAASSPTVSRSSSQPPPSPTIRVPRYLRRYTICARPTSPLANSFFPEDDALSQWDRRRSESFSVNPGPKVHHGTYTTIPSPSASSLFAPVLSRSQSLVAAVSSASQNQRPALHLRRRSSNTSIHSHSSLSITECSFHTAVDDPEYDRDQSNTLHHLSSSHTPIEPSIDRPLSIKNHCSDSSNSGFHSSGLASRGGQSSADTVVSPADAIKEKQDDEDDEWPVTYLTTITRQELDQYDKENKTQQRRKFTWGRKEGREFTDPTTEERGRSNSRKLKKKRPESLEKGIPVPSPTFDTHPIPIYTQGEHEEFDPLKDLPTREDIGNEPQIGIVNSSDDTMQTERHPFETDIDTEAILVGQADEWEDTDRLAYRYRLERMPSEEDIWLDDAVSERIRSRTPQEILQGLDVVHEEEEEDMSSEVKLEDAQTYLEKRGSYPYLKEKGKEPHEETMVEQDRPPDVKYQAEEAVAADSGKPDANCEDTPQPVSETKTPSSSRRRKLSKRRRSRRNFNNSPPPPLPEGKPKTKRPASSSKKPSMTTLRPRRTPKTVMSSVRFHVFRPLSSFALFLGIDVANGRRRLSRELRTPNALLVGRHFSEKHIPRFPSRLDGKRTVDKKIAKYD